MPRATLVLKFLGLSAFWGLVLGAGLGLIGGLLGGIYGALFIGFLGAITGTWLGGLYGIVWGLITVIFFYTYIDEVRYKHNAMIAAMALTFPVALLLFSSILNLYSVVGNVELWGILVPTTIATLAAGYASRHVAKWYIRLSE